MAPGYGRRIRSRRLSYVKYLKQIKEKKMYIERKNERERKKKVEDNFVAYDRRLENVPEWNYHQIKRLQECNIWFRRRRLYGAPVFHAPPVHLQLRLPPLVRLLFLTHESHWVGTEMKEVKKLRVGHSINRKVWDWANNKMRKLVAH